MHQCYVRATVGTERMDAFSMEVRKPEEGDGNTAARIRTGTAVYTVSKKQADYADAEGKKKVGDYHKGVEELEESDDQGEAEEPPDDSRTPQERHEEANE